METIVMPRRFVALGTALLACLFVAWLVACSSTPVAVMPETAEPVASPPAPSATPDVKTLMAACPVTEPEWVKPPEDSAVSGPPGFGYYYLNSDRSIWASAWWMGQEEQVLRVTEEGIKVGWFRPAGAELEITGRRIDGDAPPLEAEASCCYPTRFQASGLYFSTGGCWEVNAKAAESELSFVVWVER